MVDVAKARPDLRISLCGVRLGNPTILASGFLGVSPFTLERVAACGAGAVTMKSVGKTPWAGYPNPTVVANKDYMLNAVGLPTAGYRNIEHEWAGLRKLKVPFIASLYGTSPEEFVEVAADFAARKPPLIELDMSCPHAKKGGHMFATNLELARELVEKVKAVTGKVPVFAKLSPNCSNIGEIAAACVEAGADGVTAINTVSAMAIDIRAKAPVLHNKRGGLSGPALKPIAVKCVFDVFERVREKRVPIIATGGITSGEDAIEMLMAGGTGLGVGTATYLRGIDCFKKITDEMSEWMRENGYSKVSQLVGAAHE